MLNEASLQPVRSFIPLVHLRITSSIAFIMVDFSSGCPGEGEGIGG